jgi:hypothetical protein
MHITQGIGVVENDRCTLGAGQKPLAVLAGINLFDI